jgi:hypothetical protein
MDVPRNCVVGTSILHGSSTCRNCKVSCDEHPKKMTRLDVPSLVQIQHLTLEVSPVITIIIRWLIQFGLMICNRRPYCLVVMVG